MGEYQHGIAQRTQGRGQQYPDGLHPNARHGHPEECGNEDAPERCVSSEIPREVRGIGCPAQWNRGRENCHERESNDSAAGGCIRGSGCSLDRDDTHHREYADQDECHDLLESMEEVVTVKGRSEEHTSELQSQSNLVCRLLLEKKKQYTTLYMIID